MRGFRYLIDRFVSKIWTQFFLNDLKLFIIIKIIDSKLLLIDGKFSYKDI